MARPLAEIVEDIEGELRPLKDGVDAKCEIEKQIALAISQTPFRAAFKRAAAVPRLAGKAAEALNAVRNSLPVSSDDIFLPPLFVEARQEISAMAATLAYFETLSGPDEKKDVEKWCCAMFAHALMRAVSTRKPTSSSPNSTLRMVTSLIYEAVSGNAGEDMERACESVALFYRPEK